MSSSSAIPYLLALDTSSFCFGAALTGPDGELVAEAALEAGTGRGEALGDCVSEVLATAGIGPAQLGLLAVARGPGSFTGIRVGLAMARGLALIDDLSVIGIDSLELVAHSAGEANRRVCAVLCAGQDRLYVAGYQRDDSGLRCTLPAMAIGLAGLDPVIEAWGGRVALCAERETLDLIRAAQAAKRPDRLVAVADARARFLAELAVLRRDTAAAASSVLPLYVAETRARPNRNRIATSPDELN